MPAVRDQIKIWRLPDLDDIELHRGTSVFRSYPRHWHEEFHFCLIEAGGGDLHYRGTEHHTPTGCLFIVHPGEVHSNRAADDVGCTYRNLYVKPDLLQQVTNEISGQNSVPFFPKPVLFDPAILHQYLTLHQALENSASRLEQDSLMLNLFVALIRDYSAEHPSLLRTHRERQSVWRVRDYLTDHYAENVSLLDLAQIAKLSPFHLSRVFCSEIGLPPHAFQTQVRMMRARTLLHKGWTISQVACATGFADQSHFTRHFKRLFGVPPGEYLRRIT